MSDTASAAIAAAMAANVDVSALDPDEHNNHIRRGFEIGYRHHSSYREMDMYRWCFNRERDSELDEQTVDTLFPHQRNVFKALPCSALFDAIDLGRVGYVRHINFDAPRGRRFIFFHDEQENIEDPRDILLREIRKHLNDVNTVSCNEVDLAEWLSACNDLLERSKPFQLDAELFHLKKRLLSDKTRMHDRRCELTRRELVRHAVMADHNAKACAVQTRMAQRHQQQRKQQKSVPRRQQQQQQQHRNGGRKNRGGR